MPKSSATKSTKKRVNVKDLPAAEKKLSEKQMKKVKGGMMAMNMSFVKPPNPGTK
ncbi:MAG: hypothetical protein H7Y30_05435 [Pyrinomonadaceae bacterium]|nr:hypothetical protein [Pyrinomonadaceae bacterium]